MADGTGETTGPAEESTLLAERKRFSRITEADEALLRGLGPILERAATRLVDAFYDHLTRYETLRPLLSNPATVERLKHLQRDYLLSLASGRYDEAYARGRVAIGKVHERIGLQPQWYLGSYCLYLEHLLPLVEERYGADPRRAMQAAAALGKLLILDMQLVLDAYYEVRHQKAVERSEQLAVIGELAASVAHEVRNPLAGMRGALEVLRKDLAKRANQEVVDDLLAEIDRLGRLVRDLLSFANPRPRSPRVFDLQELLDRLLRDYSKLMESAGITVHRVYEPSGGRLCADPEQMEQVFLNLVHNAVHAMEDGGELTLSARARDGRLVVAVQDTGTGIAPDALHRIFQPFYTTKHRGSGLGLSIVKKIVEGHGGAIEVASEPGRGTTVTVTLPANGVA